jgi:hypothetical protein
MAVCGKCGSAIQPGTSFCGICGTPAQPGAGAGPTPPPPPPPVYYPPPASGTISAPNLVARVTNILTKPNQEWGVIAGESTSVAALYSGYIVILAAIPVLATFLQMSVFGFGFLRIGLGIGLAAAIVQYVLSLGGAYLSAFVIEKLAPNFQSQGDTLQALKLVAYASTAVWVAGVLNLLPFIGFLGVFLGGVYSIYLFYVGLPVIMKTPQDKVIPYMIVSAVVILVIYVVIAFVSSAITAGALLGGRIIG